MGGKGRERGGGEREGESLKRPSYTNFLCNHDTKVVRTVIRLTSLLDRFVLFYLFHHEARLYIYTLI